MKTLKYTALIFLVGAFLHSCTMMKDVDFIGYNGVVYTVDSAFSMAEAFAVKDVKIVSARRGDVVASAKKELEKLQKISIRLPQ